MSWWWGWKGFSVTARSALLGSGLWRPNTWGDPTAVPSFAEMLVAHAKPQKSVDQMQTIIEQGNKERLY